MEAIHRNPGMPTALDQKELSAAVERKMGTVLQSMCSRERSCNAGTPSELRSKIYLSGQSPDGRTPTKSTIKPPASLSKVEATALSNSINRKMDNVLQSMRSREAASSGSSGKDGTREGDRDERLSTNQEEFETFSSDGEDDPGDGMPVDSMANFIPIKQVEKEMGAVKRERGNLAGKRAMRKSSVDKKEGEHPPQLSPKGSGHGVGRLMKKLTGGKKFSAGFLTPRKGNKE